MIDIFSEQPVPLNVARRDLIPRKAGKPIAPSSLWRWIHKGLRAADGTVVKLEIVRIGGVPMTSRNAIQRFCDALTAGNKTAGIAEESAAPVRTPATERRLRDNGLLPPDPPK